MPPGPTEAPLCQLPLEILYDIFNHLDVPDILRLRRVSRYLNLVSFHSSVWSDAYRKADFVRPPGPFPSQSTRYLEDSLVTSFRVDRNLRRSAGPSQSERSARKLREIQYAETVIYIGLVFGRFLVVAFRMEVRCYDLDHDNSDASVLYRSTGELLESSRCVSATGVKGRPLACMVLNEVTGMTCQISIYSLIPKKESELNMELLHWSEYYSMFKIDAINLGPRVIIIQGREGTGRDAQRLIALDVCTHTQFQLPSFFLHSVWQPDQISELSADEETPPTSISTSTHLLLVKSFYVSAARRWKTFILAYALPHQNTLHAFTPSTSFPPDLSHCGILFDAYISNFPLLQDSILDPTTQDVLISVRAYQVQMDTGYPEMSGTQHGILRLNAVHIFHGINHNLGIGTVTLKLGSPIIRSRASFRHPSFNGTGRAVDSFDTDDGWVVKVIDYQVRTRSDAREDEDEVKVISHNPVLWLVVAWTKRILADFDPYFGRLCVQEFTKTGNVVQVFDLAV